MDPSVVSLGISVRTNVPVPDEYRSEAFRIHSSGSALMSLRAARTTFCSIIVRYIAQVFRKAGDGSAVADSITEGRALFKSHLVAKGYLLDSTSLDTELG